jgi:hypothetical protein
LLTKLESVWNFARVKLLESTLFLLRFQKNKDEFC